MAGQRTLLVFYSRSGTTRTVAKALSERLKCDLEEIVEPISRAGVLGYLRTVVEARSKRASQIAPIQRDVASYDLVIVGTPVFAWSVSPPVRAYLTATAGRLPEVAFFATLGGAGSERTFAQMEAIVGKKPRAVCAITARDLASGNHRERLSAFADALESAANAIIRSIRGRSLRHAG